MAEQPTTGIVETIIEPDLPIIDAHHHLWYHPDAGSVEDIPADDTELGPLRRNFTRYPRYLFDEVLADATSGHNVRATVYVEAHSMYRADGPEELRSLGEVEFANGMAAIAASRAFGDVAICAGIVGGIDLRRGDAARPVLEAHIQAGGGRYRGIRAGNIAYDPRLPVISERIGSTPGTMSDARFREGFRHLADLGLTCDIFLFEPQLLDFIEFANSFPDTQMILNHVGMPIGLGSYDGTHAERLPIWRANLKRVGRQCPNVVLKVGGLGNAMCGLPSLGRPETVGSEALAELWRPYVEGSIEAFGPDRCMFESNFPVDGVAANYPVVWNAFKRLAKGTSATEKAALFSGTAARVYRLEI